MKPAKFILIPTMLYIMWWGNIYLAVETYKIYIDTYNSSVNPPPITRVLWTTSIQICHLRGCAVQVSSNHTNQTINLSFVCFGHDCTALGWPRLPLQLSQEPCASPQHPFDSTMLVPLLICSVFVKA